MHRLASFSKHKIVSEMKFPNENCKMQLPLFLPKPSD